MCIRDRLHTVAQEKTKMQEDLEIFFRIVRRQGCARLWRTISIKNAAARSAQIDAAIELGVARNRVELAILVGDVYKRQG